MGENQQMAEWASESLGAWSAGHIDRCHDLIMMHLSGSMQGLSLNSGNGLNGGQSGLGGGGPASSSSNPGVDASNVDSGAIDLVGSSTQVLFAKWIEEQEYSTLHNTLLVHFLSSGDALPFKWSDLSRHRGSNATESHSNKSLPHASSSSHSKASAAMSPESLQASLQRNGRLEPSRYASPSIEASLAALGIYLPLAWYNLVVLHTSRGHLRAALRTCDEVLDLLWNPLSDSHDPLAIKFGLLFLYILVKLNFSSHPRHTSLTTDLEKLINHRLNATLNTPEHVSCLEQNVWFHVLRAQLSLILLRMKSSKREVSAMMGAYSKWSNAKMEQLSTAEGAGPNSSTGPKKTDEEAVAKLLSSGDQVHCAMQFVKSRLLDLRNNQEKAEADLKDPSLLAMAAAPFYNNLGVLSFHRRKFAVASLYFLKASQENQKARTAAMAQLPSDSRRQVPESVIDLATDVTYNMGLQMLMLGQFEGALRCFQEVVDKPNVSSTCSQPYAHLRLGEAQLAVYCMKVSAHANAAPPRPPSPVSSGSSPSLSHSSSSASSTASSSSSSSILSTTPTYASSGSSLPSLSSTSGSGSPTPSSSSPKPQSPPTKTIAELFREGGQLKLHRIRSTELDTLLDSATNSILTACLLLDRLGKSTSPGRTARDFLVKVYVHTMLAWLSLENSNFVKAKEWCLSAVATYNELDSPSVSTALLNSAQFSPSEKSLFDHLFFLSHLYQAEAELRLGALDAALVILQEAPVHLSKFPLLPSTHPSGTGLQAEPPSKGTAALGIVPPKTALLCNMAAVYIVKKDVAQAQRLLSQALTQYPNLLPAVALQIYLELSVGNVDLAVRLMCDFRVQDLLCLR